MRRSKFSQVMLNWTPKAVALILAAIIYIAIVNSSSEVRTVTIPLSITYPQYLVAGSTVPSSVEVDICGPADVIYLLNPEKIVASADFSGVTEPGIATAAVTLSYDPGAFAGGKDLQLRCTPETFRVLFQKAGASSPTV